MRKVVVLTWLAVGFFLQAAAYFGLAARIGIPQSPSYSSPRLQFAPVVFIGGVVMVFLAAVIYELLPDRKRRRDPGSDD